MTLRLALEPVVAVLAELRGGVVDDRAVARADRVEVELEQALERREVGRQRSLARRDEDAPLPEHRVAREEHALGEQADAVR